jgi:hypothetical protein
VAVVAVAAAGGLVVAGAMGMVLGMAVLPGVAAGAVMPGAGPAGWCSRRRRRRGMDA